MVAFGNSVVIFSFQWLHRTSEVDAESEFTLNPPLKLRYHRIKKSDAGGSSAMPRKFSLEAKGALDLFL